jgi:hypothetical protein
MKNELFVFREVTLARFSAGFARIDSELAFYRHEEAKMCAEKKFRPEKSGCALETYRYEILSLPIADFTGYYTKEIFSVDGVLLTTEICDDLGLTELHTRTPVPECAKQGDIVLLFKNLECGRSSFVSQQTAVVIQCIDDTGREDVTIGYLSEDGYFGHRHDAAFLVKTVLAPSQYGAREEVLRAAFRAWTDPTGSSEQMRQFLGGDLPWFDL